MEAVYWLRGLNPQDMSLRVGWATCYDLQGWGNEDIKWGNDLNTNKNMYTHCFLDKGRVTGRPHHLSHKLATVTFT